MRGAGGLLTIYLKADSIAKVEAFHRLQRFLLAVSWGGSNSLVLPTRRLSKPPVANSPQNPRI